MVQIETLKKVFISYSREDSAFVKKLTEDLKKKGVDVWIDFEELIPGTPDWETALREAIDESFAILLIATPASRRSPYVRSEVLLSQAKQLPMYVLWAAGDEWIDSISMNLAHTQYLDFRKASYHTGFLDLENELSRLGLVTPNHFLYKSFYIKLPLEAQKPKDYQQYRSIYVLDMPYIVYQKEFIGTHIQIDRCDVFVELEKRDAVDVIFIKPSAYKMGIQLLDEIYMNYLPDRFPPFSYGTQWLLESVSIHQTAQYVFDYNYFRC